MNEISKAIEVTGSASALARLLDVSVQSVCFWRDGKRSVPLSKCTDIERVTNGAVTRQQLRPDDWHRIWPELAAHEAEQETVAHPS